MMTLCPHRSWLLFVLCVSSLASASPPSAAQTCHASLQQWSTWKASVGYLVRGVGDVDADGWPDLLANGYGVTSGFNYPPNFAVISGRDARLLYAYDRDTPIGTTVYRRPCAAGDVNADGHADFIFGAESAAGLGYHVISGKDGSVLHVLAGDQNAALGDVNGDGHGDIASADYQHVDVVSGRDFSVLFSIPSDLTGSAAVFAYDIAAAGDVSGDGIPDFAFRGWDRADFSAPMHFFVRVHSGADGSELLHISAPEIAEYVLVGGPSPTLAAFGDLDRDGHGDLAVATSYHAPASSQVVVVSGATGAILRSYTDPDLSFGGSVAVPGDLSGDGVPDILAGTANAADGFNYGRVTLFSGADGSVLASFQGSQPTYGFGNTLDALGDVTGDGVPDFVVGAGGISQIIGEPRVCIYSGADLPIDDVAVGEAAFHAAISPVLTVESRFAPSTKTTLTLVNADPLQPAWLVIGASLIDPDPFGTHPSPDVLLPLDLRADGTTTLSLRWPARTASGPVTVYLRADNGTGGVSNILSASF